MVDFTRNASNNGGTGGLGDLVPFLGSQSPLLQIANTVTFQLQQGATPTDAAEAIARACTQHKDPILSAAELVDVQNVAVPRDQTVLQRVKITR
jgi:hypothetical protein